MTIDSPPPGAGPNFDLTEFHRTTRMPLDAVVRLHFEGTVAYQNGFAANVSAKGMFVKHPDPSPVGTRLVFEFVLGEMRKPVQGAGVVSWVREKYEGPGRTAGIGIQFTEMDALSRQHIAEGLFEYLESQLGVELADHPEAQKLVDSVPTSTPVEISIEPPPRSPDVVIPPPPEEGAVETEVESKVEPTKPTPGLPFRIFDEHPAASGEGIPPGEDLFHPEVPPEENLAAPAYGSAGKRQRKPWLALGIAAICFIGALAAWWFLLGPGAHGESAKTSPAPAAAAEASSRSNPAPAPLSAQPAGNQTLVQAVRATPETSRATATPPEAQEPATTPSPAPAPEPAAAAAGEASAPAAAPGEAAPTHPATHLQRITWATEAGVTVVSLTGDGSFPAGSYHWYAMGGTAPRVLVKLTGIAEAFRPNSLAANTPELTDIRVGFHLQNTGSELHVVLDLASSKVKVASVGSDGSVLRVRLESR